MKIKKNSQNTFIGLVYIRNGLILLIGKSKWLCIYFLRVVLPDQDIVWTLSFQIKQMEWGPQQTLPYSQVPLKAASSSRVAEAYLSGVRGIISHYFSLLPEGSERPRLTGFVMCSLRCPRNKSGQSNESSSSFSPAPSRWDLTWPGASPDSHDIENVWTFYTFTQLTLSPEGRHEISIPPSTH